MKLVYIIFNDMHSGGGGRNSHKRLMTKRCWTFIKDLWYRFVSAYENTTYSEDFQILIADFAIKNKLNRRD